MWAGKILPFSVRSPQKKSAVTCDIQKLRKKCKNCHFSDMISLQENYLSKDAFKNNFKKLEVKFCAIGALWSPPKKK